MHKHQITLLELAKTGERMTRRELAKKMGIASMSTVCFHINQLEEQGYELNFDQRIYGPGRYIKRLQLKKELEQVIAINKSDLDSGNLEEGGINYGKGVIDCCEYLLGLYGLKE